ncbi:tyrosine-type recombinase/integrase [Nocardia sp. NPDC057455]|uniref:tyrosine-type recombinase/integrase n=1 Tax=Nocardia sp. NPDC057455 TaxID=3346138 RepID=UPI00366EB951
MAWQVLFSVEVGGRRRQSAETFDDYEEASRWAALLARVGVEVARKVLEAQRGSRPEHITLSQWLRHYTDRLTGIQENVRRKYHGYIRNDIDEFMGHLPIAAITQDTDAAWVVYLEQDKGNAPKTIQNKHGFLCAGMRAAAEQRPQPLIPFNPCTGTRLPRHDAPEIDIFDNDEWELFEQLLAPRWRSQAEFGLVSMARPGEVGALLVRDVNRRTGAVRINKAWKDAGSKLKLGKPKSKRGVRTVNVPLETLDRLDLTRPGEELLFHTVIGTPITAAVFYKDAWQPALRRLDALACGDFSLFTRKSRWQGGDPEELLERFASTVDSLRVKRLTPYTLRHTGISWKLQDGVPIFVVSRDAGHESVTTTDRRYGHNDRAASESAAQVIAGRLPRVRSEMLTLTA